MQTDGKIVLGGFFTSVLGQTRSSLARVNVDGTLDAAYNPNVVYAVDAMVIQTDGKVVIGGQFNSVSSTVRNQMARINTDGTLDTSYDPNVSGWVMSMALQNNRILKIIANLPVVKIPYRSSQAIGATASNTWQSLYPVKENKRGEVALFLGCVARLTDTETLNASIYVLNRLGYSVHIPARQTCCGAIYQHSGHVHEACSLAEQNKIVFSLPNIDAIITTASGCAAQLKEFNVLDRSIPVLDINQFLASYHEWESIVLAPLPEKILIHDPCTLRNILHGQNAPYSVISRIPNNVEIVALEGNDQCCGAAGTYFLDQADISDALLESKLNAVTESGGKLLLTSNVGCSMFFVQAIRERNLGVEVLHPVVLLARQMGWQPTV